MFVLLAVALFGGAQTHVVVDARLLPRATRPRCASSEPARPATHGL